MTPADPSDPERHPVAANDNAGADDPDPQALRKVDNVVIKLARIIGRRMALEDFDKAMRAANDNKLPNTGATEDGGDEE